MQRVPLLQTKLHIPPIRPERVSRPRLLQRLNEGLHRKLILLSAPAGYGKTTLASEWVAGLEQFKPGVRAAWLSLDEGDNDPNRFLIYLVAALLIGAKPVDQALAFLLEHPPPQMRLAIARREDPGLPLARYRARGQLTGLRAADLTFTSSEAVVFLNRVMDHPASGKGFKKDVLAFPAEARA